MVYRPEVTVPSHIRILDEDFRDSLFEQTEWLIFTQENCEWSRKAIELLVQEKQKKVDIHDVNKEQLIQRCYSMTPPQPYTPIIYFKNSKDKGEHKLLGGYPELIWHFQRTIIDPANIKRPSD